MLISHSRWEIRRKMTDHKLSRLQQEEFKIFKEFATRISYHGLFAEAVFWGLSDIEDLFHGMMTLMWQCQDQTLKYFLSWLPNIYQRSCI